MVCMTAPLPLTPLLSEGVDPPLYFVFVSKSLAFVFWYGYMETERRFPRPFTTSELKKPRRRLRKWENKKCNRLNKQNKKSELAAGLFDRFLYHHHTTNVVKRHRSGNSAILVFICKIVIWLNGIVATSISSEILILSVTLTAILKSNRIKIWTKKTLQSPV